MLYTCETIMIERRKKKLWGNAKIGIVDLKTLVGSMFKLHFKVYLFIF